MASRYLVFAVVLSAAVPAAVPAAAQFAGPTLTHPSDAGSQKKTAAPAPKPMKTCDVYGAGYARVEGSNTCVKIGGYVRFQGGLNSK